MGVTHLLHYGCKDASLARLLKADHKLTYQAYDKDVERFAADPVPAQMVVCIDVLESAVDPDAVLADLVRLTEGIVFLTCPHTASQWLPKLCALWEIQSVQVLNDVSFFVVAESKGVIEGTDGTVIQ